LKTSAIASEPVGELARGRPVERAHEEVALRLVERERPGLVRAACGGDGGEQRGCREKPDVLHGLDS